MERHVKFAQKVTDSIIKGIIVQGFENDADAARIVEGQRFLIQKFLVDTIAGYEKEMFEKASPETVRKRCQEMREEALKAYQTADLLETLMVSRQDAWDAAKKEDENEQEVTS